MSHTICQEFTDAEVAGIQRRRADTLESMLEHELATTVTPSTYAGHLAAAVAALEAAAELLGADDDREQGLMWTLLAVRGLASDRHEADTDTELEAAA